MNKIEIELGCNCILLDCTEIDKFCGLITVEFKYCHKKCNSCITLNKYYFYTMKGPKYE